MDTDDDTKEQIMCVVGSKQFDYGSALVRDVKLDVRSGVSSPYPTISGRVSIHDAGISCLLVEDPLNEGYSQMHVNDESIQTIEKYLSSDNICTIMKGGQQYLPIRRWTVIQNPVILNPWTLKSKPSDPISIRGTQPTDVNSIVQSGMSLNVVLDYRSLGNGESIVVLSGIPTTTVVNIRLSKEYYDQSGLYSIVGIIPEGTRNICRGFCSLIVTLVHRCVV
eukprot:GHVR01191941.1.p2 GENE.GHVR01191941.1~~GHVR01191941.1.p2  ORF type:complete len:222 (-),score=22.54 GHVR01191941.1:312-977(-)